jgi:hypothetical protein
MSQKKLKKRERNVVIKRKDFLAGIQALTVYHQDRTNVFLSVKEQFGDQHPATLEMFQEITDLGNILNFLTGLINETNSNTETFN